jgi:predicted DNA-binding transcriptional regulator YafY
MILQSRDCATASTLAEALGVSVRTIYRDMDALSAIGVPICAEAGPSGGYRLLPGYRTELTGLTTEEISALGLLDTPTEAVDLGAGESMRRALAKILASIPRFAGSQGETTRSRVLIKPPRAARGEDAPPSLSILQEAVLNNRKARVTFQYPFNVQATHVVEPLGLVCEARRWHLVFRHGTVKTRAVASIRLAELTDDLFPTDPTFNLDRYWRTVSEEWASRAQSYVSILRIAPSALSEAERLLEGGLHPLSDEAVERVPNRPGIRTQFPPTESWPWFRCTSASLEVTRSAVLALGAAALVVEPHELRESVADYARGTLSRYDCYPEAVTDGRRPNPRTQSGPNRIQEC